MVVGTVFKTDVKLIESEKRKPYLKATAKILGQLSLFWNLGNNDIQNTKNNSVNRVIPREWNAV